MPAPVPDPQRGVFETLLVLDGRPVELDAHLARLHASLAALFPNRTPPPLDVPVKRSPYGHRSTGTSGRGALRMTVAPGDEGRLEAKVERRRALGAFFPHSGNNAPGSGISLRSLPLPGGLGAHKWADRRLLDAAQAQLPAETLPLIVDEDGDALEASRANLFAVRDGALLTPPLDGRILPGITRRRVLEIAAAAGIEAHEEWLRTADLLTADEVFLTGSVRGIERVESLDGAALTGGAEITRRIAEGLWRAWRHEGSGLARRAGRRRSAPSSLR